MTLPEELPESNDLRHKVLYNVINRLIRYCRSITPMPGGSGAKLQRNPSGYTWTPAPARPGSAGSGIYQAQFISEDDNTLSARLITNATQTVVDGVQTISGTIGAMVTVAKPFLLQRQNYDGIILPPPESYTGANTAPVYVSSSKRTVNYNATYNTGIQIIYPPYVVGGLLDISIPVGGTGLAGVTYQDTNRESREWREQMQTCENGVGMYRLFPASGAYVTAITLTSTP